MNYRPVETTTYHELNDVQHELFAVHTKLFVSDSSDENRGPYSFRLSAIPQPETVGQAVALHNAIENDEFDKDTFDAKDNELHDDITAYLDSNLSTEWRLTNAQRRRNVRIAAIGQSIKPAQFPLGLQKNYARYFRGLNADEKRYAPQLYRAEAVRRLALDSALIRADNAMDYTALGETRTRQQLFTDSLQSRTADYYQKPGAKPVIAEPVIVNQAAGPLPVVIGSEVSVVAAERKRKSKAGLFIAGLAPVAVMARLRERHAMSPYETTMESDAAVVNDRRSKWVIAGALALAAIVGISAAVSQTHTEYQAEENAASTTRFPAGADRSGLPHDPRTAVVVKELSATVSHKIPHKGEQLDKKGDSVWGELAEEWPVNFKDKPAEFKLFKEYVHHTLKHDHITNPRNLPVGYIFQQDDPVIWRMLHKNDK